MATLGRSGRHPLATILPSRPASPSRREGRSVTLTPHVLPFFDRLRLPLRVPSHRHTFHLCTYYAAVLVTGISSRIEGRTRCLRSCVCSVGWPPSPDSSSAWWLSWLVPPSTRSALCSGWPTC